MDVFATLFFAQTAVIDGPGWGLIVSAGCAAGGLWLRWKQPMLASHFEERAKDRELSEQACRRRLRLVRWSAPTLTALGFVVLGLMLVGVIP